MTRKILIALALSVLLVGVSFANGQKEATKATQAGTTQGAGFNWKANSGQTVNVVLDSHPWQKFIQPLAAEFEAKSGIHLDLQAYPEDQFRQKLLVNLSAGSTSVDSYMFMPAQDLALYGKNGWIQPIDSYLNDPSKTSPNFDVNDFFKGVRASYDVNGKTYGIPLHVETFILFYRTDLFKKFGLEVPQTMDQLKAVAEKLKQDLAAAGESNVYPIAMRGKTPDATSSMVNFLFSWGGTWFNADGSSALDSPASVQALTYYAGLLSKFGPPDATSNSWQADTQLFAQGQAAMMYDSNVFKAIVSNPQSSKVVGNVGYAPLPAGPDGKRHPTVLTWGLGINTASQHKDAAWDFIQWALDKQNQLGYLQAGGPSARASAWESPDFLSSNGYSKSWVDVSNLQYSIAKGDWNPPIVNVQQGRNAYGLAIVSAIQGNDVSTALKDSVKRMDQAVKEFGR
ncbi:MAG TPA: sugar ABC transporter substrate-binding protein [Spirochaetia bacterium]|nr:sugar ABC transporter substrate-binding protein [Spirochaetia bacterium]